MKELVVVPPTSLSSGGGKNGRKEAREDLDGGQENGQEEARGDEEPESTAQLREAVLMALASLSLFSETVRRVVTDELGLLPCLLVILNRGRRPSSSSVTPANNNASYTKPKHVGTRYAACQVVRALSRSVSVLRTSIVDSGLGMVIFRVFMDGWFVDDEGKFVDGEQGKEKGDEGKDEDGEDREDRRVVGAALTAVCNIVNEFSVLKAVRCSFVLLTKNPLIQHQFDLTDLSRPGPPKTPRLGSELWRSITKGQRPLGDQESGEEDGDGDEEGCYARAGVGVSDWVREVSF